MTKMTLPSALQGSLVQFLQKNPKADLLTSYLFFIGKKHDVDPVVFVKKKTIHQSRDVLLQKLEEAGELWRETTITIHIGQADVNENTKKIYICPFSGKVFADNTHPNPQDAIYDWVGSCAENKERAGGLRVKKFFISEDPEVIKNYIKQPEKPIQKTVFSSLISGKLFNTKKRVIEDVVENQMKPISFVDVLNQNRFTIEEEFLKLIQEHMQEEKLEEFVSLASEVNELAPYVAHWTE